VKLHRKLQARLALLVLVAVLPLVAFSIVTSLRDARRALDASRAGLELSVSLAASSLAGVSDAARGLLTAVASSAELREGDARRCENYLAHVVERFPHYADVGLVGLDGVIRCSGRARAAIGLNVGDRLYFREALVHDDFAVGEYMQGRVSGVKALGFGLPQRDAQGVPTGVIYLSLDLAGLAERLTDVRLPPGARLTVVDRHGTVLAAQAGDSIEVGETVRAEVMRRAVQQGEAGVVEGVDPGGQERIYAFAPAAGEAGSRLMASISLDRAQVVGPSMRALYTEVLLLLLLTALGAGLAWRLGGRALTRPVRRILDTADRVAAGALTERVGTFDGATADELVRVGAALDHMADALQQRQEALQDELRRSHQAQATQALVFNSMHEGLWAADLQGNLLLYNATAASIFPIVANMGEPKAWTAKFGLFVPDSQRELELEEQPLHRAMQGESGQADIAVRNDLVPGGCVLRCSYRPLTGAGGELIGGLVVFSDITELRKAEMQEARIYARLRETQRRLVDALRVGRIGNWEQDLRTGESWWSDEVYEMFGLTRADAREGDAALLARLHPDDVEAFTEHRRTAARREGTVDIEFRVQMPDGSVRWMLKRGQVYRGAGGEAVKRSGVIQDITQRKKSQAELLLLRNAVEHINDIVVIARVEPARGDDGHEAPAARVLYANPAFERLTGHSSDAVTGQPMPWLDGAGTCPQARAHLEAAVNGRQAVRQELLAYTRAGAEIWLEFDVVPFGDQQAGAGDLILVGRDITDRKRAETALAESEERLQALFEHGPMPMWVFEENTGRLLAVNNAVLQQYGYSREEMVGLTLMDMRPERDRERMERRIREGYQGVAEGWTHRRRDGSEFPVDVMSNPVRYGGIDARFAVIHDITGRVQAEQNLQEHLFTLQRATDATQMVLSHQTLQGTLHEVVEQARAVIRAHQCVISLVHGGDWAHAVHATSMSDRYDDWRGHSYEPPDGGIHDVVRETNRPLRLSDAALRAHPRWPSGLEGVAHPPMRAWLGVPLTNRRGENIGVLQLTDKYEGEFSLQDEYVAMEMAQLASIALENVTLLEEVRALNSGLERKVHERTLELMREQARYRAVTDQAPQIIWSYESGKGVTYFNRNWYELVGGTSDYWLGGNRWVDVIHPEDRDNSLANWVVARQTRTVYKGERRIRDKFGRYHIMSYRGAPVYDDAGRVICWVGIDTDITESKMVEAQLRESNRELEAFSYSVSHDLRSPLNTIHGFSKLLAREIQPAEGSRVPHYLERIQAATGYMGQLIEDLLSLAQVSRANLRNEAVDLSEVARGILDRLQQNEPHRSVRVHVQGGLIGWGDVRLLRVMLENLLANAWKFTSQTADASIEVGVEDEGVFFVRDNGAGFDMTYADKLFGVFHRLHAATEFPGTGIGLATVHRIVTRHQGRVWADARPGQGATFRFVLGTVPSAALADEVMAVHPPGNP
jgi:PAS domain S-box-containing protein